MERKGFGELVIDLSMFYTVLEWLSLTELFTVCGLTDNSINDLFFSPEGETDSYSSSCSTVYSRFCL